MSRRTGRSEHGARVVVGSVAAGAALVLVMWLGLRSTAPAPAGEAAPVQAARVGVTPAAADPARWREVSDDPGERRMVAALPVPREQLSPERQRALDDPPPPIPGDPVLLAAAAARQSAFPVATEALAAALADRRPALARACWQGGSEAANISFQASFDASGALTDHQVADDGKAPAGLTECIRKQPFTLTIAPPGADVRVRATIVLP